MKWNKYILEKLIWFGASVRLLGCFLKRKILIFWLDNEITIRSHFYFPSSNWFPNHISENPIFGYLYPTPISLHQRRDDPQTVSRRHLPIFGRRRRKIFTFLTDCKLYCLHWCHWVLETRKSWKNISILSLILWSTKVNQIPTQLSDFTQ